ncbi:MAG TPA: alpha/beta hydrolase [Acetobacteraceae bacterium]|nr:alpha/beta hydrolase [Acetobacteraceae bacterium]
MQSIGPVALGIALLLGAVAGVQATETLPPRVVPARSIPVPDTVSPQIQTLIALPLRPGWNVLPKNADEWRSTVKAAADASLRVLPGMRERLHVSVKETTIAGVHAFLVSPETVPPENRDRLLVHVHGGCYVLGPGQAATPEAVLMAGFGHFNVISVDYRMPPDAYFPAALDDAMAVWKATVAQHDPKKLAIFGSSAGGALTLEMILRAKREGLPLPAAIAPGTPMADTTKVGDTFQTNALLDNVLVSPDGICDAATRFYANGHSRSDPLLSPVYGDMHGFPPTILTSGTRDLLLSNTVRVHRKLREAGVEASLQVFEAQSHAQYGRDDQAPETREAFEEIAEFFDRHLAK